MKKAVAEVIVSAFPAKWHATVGAIAGPSRVITLRDFSYFDRSDLNDLED